MFLSMLKNSVDQPQPPSVVMVVKDQSTKENRSLLLFKDESNTSQLVQPSRIVPRTFVSWDTWEMQRITVASGEVSSVLIDCLGYSSLKVAPSFVSPSEGSCKLLVLGTTQGGATIPIELLTIAASGDSFPWIPYDGLTQRYVVKPVTINISGMVSVQLRARATAGELNIQLGVF